MEAGAKEVLLSSVDGSLVLCRISGSDSQLHPRIINTAYIHCLPCPYHLCVRAWKWGERWKKLGTKNLFFRLSVRKKCCRIKYSCRFSVVHVANVPREGLLNLNFVDFILSRLKPDKDQTWTKVSTEVWLSFLGQCFFCAPFCSSLL